MDKLLKSVEFLKEMTPAGEQSVLTTSMGESQVVTIVYREIPVAIVSCDGIVNKKLTDKANRRIMEYTNDK